MIRLYFLSITFAFLLKGHGFALTLENQQVRDFEVFCKDNRYCIAITHGTSSNGDKMRFKLERANDADSIIYVTTAPRGPKLAIGMKVSVSVSGYDTTYSGAIKTVYDNNEMAFKEKIDSGLIDLLKKGRFGTVKVEYGGSTGTIAYDISLQGVTSALALMDIVQGRLDRNDAAVVRGGEALTSVSSYDYRDAKGPEVIVEKGQTRDPEEGIDYGDEDEVAVNNEPDEESGLGLSQLKYGQAGLPDRVLMHGYRVLGCDFPDVLDAFGWEEVNIEPGVFLYFVSCQNADLNVPFYIAIEDAGQIRILDFQEAASETGERVGLISNPRWEKGRDGITMYEYYSPGQDCGKHEFHIFDYQEQTFYLSEARIKDSCDGVLTQPENYPLSWNGEGD